MSLAPRALPAYAHALDHGIVAIDTGFHRPAFDAAYLVVEHGRGAFVDTGTNDSVPRLLETAASLGLAPEAVDWVIATHVHLDHAGGVGRLMQALPSARLVVHPLGAPHLVDPSRLMQSARTVYGEEEVARTYGELLPVPDERILRSGDGMTIELAGRPLELIDTPGHARHHHGIWDARSRGFFSGDTFGLSYREFDTARGAWMLPTTTPVQFEPDAMRRSIERILSYEPAWLYLTHYGRVGEPARLAGLLLGQLDEMVALAVSLPEDGDRFDRMRAGFLAIWRRSLEAHGCTRSADEIERLLALDAELDAQGVTVWLQRRARRAPGDRPPADGAASGAGSPPASIAGE